MWWKFIQLSRFFVLQIRNIELVLKSKLRVFFQPYFLSAEEEIFNKLNKKIRHGSVELTPGSSGSGKMKVEDYLNFTGRNVFVKFHHKVRNRVYQGSFKQGVGWSRGAFIKIFMSLVLLILFTACTYSFSGYFPSYLKKVSVHVFQNKTLMYGLDNTVTGYFIDELRKDGRFQLVSDSKAGMIITGSITNYQKQPFKYDAEGNIESYNIRLTLELEFYDNINKKPYLPKASYTGSGTYSVNGETEDDGIKRAVEDIYSTVIHRLFQVSF